VSRRERLPERWTACHCGPTAGAERCARRMCVMAPCWDLKCRWVASRYADDTLESDFHSNPVEVIKRSNGNAQFPRYRWTQHEIRSAICGVWTDPEYPLKSLSHDRSFVVGDTYSMTRGT